MLLSSPVCCVVSVVSCLCVCPATVCGVPVWSYVHVFLMLYAAVVLELVSWYGRDVFSVHVSFVTLCLAVEVRKLCLLLKGWKHPFVRYEYAFYLYSAYHIAHSTMVDKSQAMYIAQSEHTQHSTRQGNVTRAHRLIPLLSSCVFCLCCRV